MKKHTFHIPVMGIGFTIDTPLKVSHLGIDSVISLVDDILMEKLRKMYSEKLELPFQEISNKVEDFRAKRITSYLNLINDLAEKKFNEIKTAAVEKSHEVKDYFNMLPDSVELKHEFNSLMSKHLHIDEFRSWVNENMKMGNIDVNIISQTPKLKKYKKKIVFNIANLCKISTNNVNVKAKTTEKLGVIGKEKAIAAEVIVSVIKHD